MTKPKAPKRLKKGPDIQDYVVERIDYPNTDVYPNTDGQRITYSYFKTRAEARDLVRTSRHDRVRVFKAKYSLVSDSRRKK